MHVLLIHQAFVPLDEAGGTRHHELARYLAGLGNKITVITSPVSYLTGTTGRKEPSHDLNDARGKILILRTNTYSGLHRSFAHRVLSFFSFMVSSFWIGLRVHNVDLVWGTSPPIFQGFTCWLLARLKRVPFLFEVRDLWPAFAVEVGILRQPLLIRASEWLERFLYRHADQLVVNSPGFVAHVEKQGGMNVAVIPNGTDPRMFNPQDPGDNFRKAHELENQYVVLYAGAHGMSNDLGVILEAASRISSRTNIAIVLLGDGKDKATLMVQAAEMKLKNVHFLPPLPKDKMCEALAGADACVAILKPIPLYATVYPNKVFDYMAAGRPVILAIDGEIRNVVEAAGAGVFTPPGDPQALADTILNFSQNPEKYRNWGLNGRQYIEEHFNRADLAKELSILMEAMAPPI